MWGGHMAKCSLQIKTNKKQFQEQDETKLKRGSTTQHQSNGQNRTTEKSIVLLMSNHDEIVLSLPNIFKLFILTGNCLFNYILIIKFQCLWRNILLYQKGYYMVINKGST